MAHVSETYTVHKVCFRVIPVSTQGLPLDSSARMYHCSERESDKRFVILYDGPEVDETARRQHIAEQGYRELTGGIFW